MLEMIVAHTLLVRGGMEICCAVSSKVKYTPSLMIRQFRSDCYCRETHGETKLCIDNLICTKVLTT